MPSPSLAFRAAGVWGDHRADEATDLAVFARRLLSKRASPTAADLRRLLGNEATDTILLRPVTELALYDERRLARAVGARGLNRDTRTIYRSSDSPEFDPQLFGGPPNGDQVAEDIALWLVGGLDGPGGTKVQSDARLYTMDRYQGLLREITP